LPGTDVVYAAARDVTEQKRAARALETHATELENANRELEAFSYSVSHDLRSPLRSIDGFAQALVEDYEDRLDDAGRDFLRRIRAAAQRMGALIDDLLSLSRVSRFELIRTDLDLTAIAGEVAAQLQASQPDRRVEWRISPRLRAHADGRLVRIVLENLLSNAWKFTSNRDDALIEFTSATAPNGEAGFVVRDNGAGFDMNHAGKLFGAFQRLHRATEFPGTGIGLATVHRAIRRHGGAIWGTGAVGHGATFQFTLEASSSCDSRAAA
jgi:light-regulated signal transduction histidine kinase (bacteriophytochrome)